MNLYNDYNSYLKQKHGCKVYRVGLDAGFSCPNRDGTKGSGGCIYCNADGSRSSYTDPEYPVGKQLSSRIEYLKKKYWPSKFIAYFQAFTNTYAPAKKLKAVYDLVLPFKEVIGISIGTRPDCIDREKLELITSYKDRYDVWLEYGMQSMHDRTLKVINRGHTFKDFLHAFDLTKRSGIAVCVHAILGLPGETKGDMIATARKISEIGANGVKIHLLHILKASALEGLYGEGRVALLEQDEYVELVCDFLENLSPDIVIQRLTGEADRENHIAPLWALDKTGTIEKIRKTLERRGSCQGRALSTPGEGARSWSRS
jgi:radical SAM protein, TIGR01212 family